MKTRAMASGIALLFGKAVLAQPVTEGGCRTLANAVRSSVEASVPGGGNSRWRPLAGSLSVRSEGSAALETCGRTAAVASVAFTEAMAAANLSIHWANREPGPREACLGHSLLQCNPVAPEGQPMSAAQRAFVADAWKGVCAGLRWQMPFGIASDISYFQPASLDASLAISLSATLDRAGRESRYIRR